MSMTLEQVIIEAYKAGFIEAAKWPSVCTQDANSRAVGDAARQWAEAHLSRQSDGVSDGWKPIETAPKNSRILIFANGQMHVAHHRSHGSVFAILEDKDNAFVCSPLPTHWMPLPMAPEADHG